MNSIYTEPPKKAVPKTLAGVGNAPRIDFMEGPPATVGSVTKAMQDQPASPKSTVGNALGALTAPARMGLGAVGTVAGTVGDAARSGVLSAFGMQPSNPTALADKGAGVIGSAVDDLGAAKRAIAPVVGRALGGEPAPAMPAASSAPAPASPAMASPTQAPATAAAQGSGPAQAAAQMTPAATDLGNGISRTDGANGTRSYSGPNGLKVDVTPSDYRPFKYSADPREAAVQKQLGLKEGDADPVNQTLRQNFGIENPEAVRSGGNNGTIFAVGDISRLGTAQAQTPTPTVGQFMASQRQAGPQFVEGTTYGFDGKPRTVMQRVYTPEDRERQELQATIEGGPSLKPGETWFDNNTASKGRRRAHEKKVAALTDLRASEQDNALSQQREARAATESAATIGELAQRMQRGEFEFGRARQVAGLQDQLAALPANDPRRQELSSLLSTVSGGSEYELKEVEGGTDKFGAKSPGSLVRFNKKTGETQAVATNQGNGQIPASAIDALRANPKLAADFDRKYGPGKAATFARQ
jgi:hypothetical protein